MNNFTTNETTTPNNDPPPQENMLPFWLYPEYKAHTLIWKIAPPIILLLGGFGNVATIFVMRRIKDHNSSQHAILMSLALSDIVLLCSATSVTWIQQFFGVDLRASHVVVCKISMWLVYVSSTTSAWLVTCVTVQRAMAVLWPHRMRVMCTVRRTWIIIAILVLTVCVLHAHLLLGFEISEKEQRCFPVTGLYHQFIGLVFTWVHLCMSSFGPGTCLFVCNIILSVTLYRALSSTSLSVDSSAGASQDSRRKTSYRTTVMVLVVSCAFLVLTSPGNFYLIWFNSSMMELQRDPRMFAVSFLVQAVTYQLLYVNSAVNFFLYCLTGTKFRREFTGWISCGALSVSSSSGHETRPEASKGERGARHGDSPLSK